METTNYQVQRFNIFGLAIQLTEQNYEELKPTNHYKTCDCIMVDHDKKRFFFTTTSTEKHINKLKELA